MYFVLLAVLGIAAGALFAYTRKEETAPVTDSTSESESESPSVQPDAPQPAPAPVDLFERIGAARGVDPDLLRAIAFVESSIRADAVRWNPPYDVSVGMMQILCTPPAGATNGEDYVCQNRFNIRGWPFRFSQLKDPELNIDVAAQILAQNLRDYSFPRGLAIYNDWAARHSGVNGPFPNDSYVNRVLARLKFLKGNKT